MATPEVGIDTHCTRWHKKEALEASLVELMREGQMAACWLEAQLGTTGYRLEALLTTTPFFSLLSCCPDTCVGGYIATQ